MGRAAKHKKRLAHPNAEAIRKIAENKRHSLASRPPASERKRSRQVEEAFLDGLRGGWSVSKSAWAAGIHERTARRWKADSCASRQEDGSYNDDFAQRWETAYESGVDKLEDAATRRAVEGVEKPVYQGGILVGSVTEYSDTLLGLMLRGKRPKVYNSERHERTGKDGGTISMSLQIEFVEPGDKK
ncbi:hypothetical protein J2R76_005813 [Bradyrhizobium sp. USDA 4532]|uniref:hypothetical protein n=1 Tax=unclassified Bradyrhizobium TaxID=2631580 RepID=UPI00209F0C84|nr:MULTISPECIES: hypothetical protein [unclassified Bradyrhizobium]MCP1829113.1 hypothetical protein [Bradyrhizobium sp. USDA 4545]MCP1922222.1 hypothetical protein [Bradyrhizobium sp. USDA 4532]